MKEKGASRKGTIGKTAVRGVLPERKPLASYGGKATSKGGPEEGPDSFIRTRTEKGLDRHVEGKGGRNT